MVKRSTEINGVISYHYYYYYYYYYYPWNRNKQIRPYVCRSRVKKE